MARISFSAGLSIFFLICSTQFVQSSYWNFSENEDFLFDWLVYAKQVYYMYELEANMTICMVRGIWDIAHNWVLTEPDTIVPQISTLFNSVVNNGSIEKSEFLTPAQNPASLVKRYKRQLRNSRFGSLLGITRTPSSMDDDHNKHVTSIIPARVKRSESKSKGALEIGVMKMMLSSHPVIAAFVKLLGAMVYLVQRAATIFKSSVVLTCISDYAYIRGSELMYLDV